MAMQAVLTAPREAPARRAAVLPGLSIVLPCFNEEANIGRAVRQASDAALRFSRRHEVIVVDDGSSDETALVAGRLATHDRSIRLVMHADNHGYGAALRSGIRAARMPWVLLTDADLQFDLFEVEDFLPLAMSSDLIVGYRIARQDPLGRRVNAAAWNWLMRCMFRLPVHDVDCAFKLVRRDLLERIELVSNGAMISTELIAKSLQLGARLTEHGVHHMPRSAGEQSGSNPRVILRAFVELSHLRGALRPTAHSAA